jgi:penicillin amidase
MRIIPFLVSAVITVALIIVLNQRLTIGDATLPPMGKFLSPQHGFWQNAEPVDAQLSLEFNFPGLKNKVDVFFDDRMVPHVFAQEDQDLYFVQGYLHARFRLWQMEFQTHAAAGRLAEIVGPGPNDNILNNDRNMRRLGMVHGARRALREIENDPDTKMMLDAYTAGVNAYIEQMTNADLPLEYRLLDYKPERWNNLKTALFLKYMSFDLTGYEEDIEHTNLQQILSKEEFETLFPLAHDSLSPIIPKGTPFPPATRQVRPPANADSVYFQWKKDIETVSVWPVNKPDKDNGSNNWAVDGSKTQSGRPILCNDPHLGLNLPALWYEMQLHSPTHNTYGVSFPGAPGIIIGFNDSCAWGVTNASRDVKDYYRISFKDETKKEYWFNGAWKASELHYDTIKIRGAAPLIDTVAYTIFGPVQYDNSFKGYKGRERTGENMNLAVRWQAHEPSNELKTFYLLNRANNYNDYLEAIRHFTCPAQNFVFASKNNQVAIWQQGVFPAKWKMQGDFVMPGEDSTYIWQDTIPQAENPHILSPTRGYVSSANQLPADTTYPYYLGGSYNVYRGVMINRRLDQMFNITPKDMQQLQMENYNVMAETILPVLVRNVDEEELDADELKYFNIVRRWNLRNDPKEQGATIFRIWLDSLAHEIWADELSAARGPIVYPELATLVEALKRDSAFSFIDNIKTPGQESLAMVATAAFKKAAREVENLDRGGLLDWSRYKGTGIRHLLQLEPLSRYNLVTGGGEHIVNAAKKWHGPSWRMVVHLTDETEAYGVYPGGQSGNPGSKYYDNFVDDWAAGKYNTLWVMRPDQANDKRILYKMTFSK